MQLQCSARKHRSCGRLPVLILACFTTTLYASSIQAQVDSGVAPPGGRCGPDVKAVCPEPQCCSRYGFCGVTAVHCGDDCQPDWGNKCQSSDSREAYQQKSTASKPPIDSSPSPAQTSSTSRDQSLAAGAATAAQGGECGSKINTVCPADQCCSTAGHCGWSVDHCLANVCQTAWGVCGPEYIREPNTTVGSLKARPDKTTKAAEPGGRCGAVVDTMCVNQCCSNEGYCGVTPSHCDVGKCVELWGSCPGKPPPTDPPQDSGDRALDTKTIVGMVSAIVVGLGATVGLSYTAWKWWHKHRAVKAIKKQGITSSLGTGGPSPRPPPTGVLHSLVLPRVKDAAAVKVQRLPQVPARP